MESVVILSQLIRRNYPARLVFALLAAALTCGVASAQTFTLGGQFSNGANGSGPWSYRQGSTRLPIAHNWGGDGVTNCNQTAWAPSANGSDVLPAIFRANECTAVALDIASNHDYNVLAGDVIIHSVDDVSGNTAGGPANVLFQLPYGDQGNFKISGSLWNASLYYGTTRPQDWVLRVNGAVRASGTIPGLVLRTQPLTFSVTTALAGGDTVELDIVKDHYSQYGDFIGTSLTIQPATAPPPPTTCTLTDAPSYNASTSTLTMKFSVATPTTATWRTWLVSQGGLRALFSQSLATTEPAVAQTKTASVAKSGVVGILSTLTTPASGITCSSYVTVNTGKP
jgi:hypothetical protein